MLPWLAVIALGGGVGLAELASRYRDQPSALPKSPSFWAYLTLNAAASALAYALAKLYGWTLGLDPGIARTTTLVLVSGLAAMAVFRSSLFNLKIGDTNVSIGPNALLTSLLTAVDRAVDRRRAIERSPAVAATMNAVSFAKAKIALPAYCLQLMQNVSVEEQLELRNRVDALGLADMEDSLKSLNLGLLLMNVVGPDVLKAAINDLRPMISTLPPETPPPSTRPPQGGFSDRTSVGDNATVAGENRQPVDDGGEAASTNGEESSPSLGVPAAPNTSDQAEKAAK